MKPGDTPVILTDDEITRLVDSAGLRNGVLKDKVIEEIKKINSKEYREDKNIKLEDKIRRNVDVLIQLASHPCGQFNTIGQEYEFLNNIQKTRNTSEYNDDEKKLKLDSFLFSFSSSIARYLVFGFDDVDAVNLKIDWTTGKITGLNTRFEKCTYFDVPISMDKDVCFQPIIKGKYGNLTESQAQELVDLIKYDERIVEIYKKYKPEDLSKTLGINYDQYREIVKKLLIGQPLIYPFEILKLNLQDPIVNTQLISEFVRMDSIINENVSNEIAKNMLMPKITSVVFVSILDATYGQALYGAGNYTGIKGDVDRRYVGINLRGEEVYPYNILIPIFANISIKYDNLKSRLLSDVVMTIIDNHIKESELNDKQQKIKENITDEKIKDLIKKYDDELFPLYESSNDSDRNKATAGYRKYSHEILNLILKDTDIQTIYKKYGVPDDNSNIDLSRMMVSSETIDKINRTIDKSKILEKIDKSREYNPFTTGYNKTGSKRKTPRRKVSKRKTLRGGKVFVGQQGCVTAPSLVYNCLTRSRNGMRVTKIFFKEEDYIKEKQENDKILQEVDPQGEFTSAKYDESPIDLTKLQQDEIAECGEDRPYSTLKHLNYKYLGNSLDTIIPEANFDKDSSKLIIQALANLAPKIKEMNSKGFYHNDLHFGNVTYLPSEKRSYLIDFGHSGNLRHPKPNDLVGLIGIMHMLANRINDNESIPQPMKDSASNFSKLSKNVTLQFDNSPTYTKEIEDLIMKTITDFANEYTNL